MYDEIHVLVTNWGVHASNPLKSVVRELWQYRVDIDDETSVVNFRSRTAGGKLGDNDVETIYSTVSSMGIITRRDV